MVGTRWTRLAGVRPAGRTARSAGAEPQRSLDMRTNLHHLLQRAAADRPDSPALTYRDQTVTYGELWSRTHAFAGGLAGLGLERDDRVGIYLDKRIETVEAIFGTSVAGGVFVPVNHILKAPQVGYILADCDVRVLVTS